MKRIKMSAFFFDPIPIKFLPEGEKVLYSIVSVLMHVNLLHATLKMVFIRLYVLVLINNTV